MGRILIIVTGAIGFAIGLAFADWQVSVESAQAIAGIVEYPADNPFYIYHLKIWTLLNQINALILLAGVSEIALSKLISGVLGMITFQGWAMVVYALSRDPVLAIGAPFVLFLSRIAQFGVVYPIFLVDTSDTYGVVGLAMLVLVAGLVGGGWYRAGLLLAGAAPAIHPALGVWLLAIAALAVALDFKAWTRELRPWWRWFAAGCLVTAISLIAELVLIRNLPDVPHGFARKFFLAFAQFWDGHRQPAPMKTIGVALNVGAFGLAALWLTVFRGDVPRAAKFLLRFCAVSAVLSVAFGFMSWIPPERLPTWLLVLMPARLLNFNALVFPALLFGLLGIYRDRVWSYPLAIVLSLRLLLSGRSVVWRWLERPGADGPEIQIPLFWSVAAASVALVVCVAASRFTRSARLEAGPAAARSYVRIARIAAVVLFAAAGVVSLDLGRRHAREVLAARFRDWTNDGFFAAVARGRGVLATAGDLHLIQLRTRRPVLVDGGGLDGVAYALEASSALDRVLRQAYGVDVFAPPEEAYGGGRVPSAANRAAWERFSIDQWKAIRQTFGVTQVLAFPDWTLPLVPVAQNRHAAFYEIPR